MSKSIKMLTFITPGLFKNCSLWKNGQF